MLDAEGLLYKCEDVLREIIHESEKNNRKDRVLVLKFTRMIIVKLRETGIATTANLDKYLNHILKESQK